MRSVRWRPSLRVKAQDTPISFTAKSLPLRSVNVTRAFDPSPPLRQDCEEIESRSSGASSTSVGPTEAGVTVAVSIGAVAGFTGFDGEAFWAGIPTGEAAATVRTPVGLESVIHARHPARATTASKPSMALEFPRRPLPSEELRPTSRVNSVRAIRPGKGSPGDGATSKVMAMPSKRPHRTGHAAQQEAARALHRAALVTTADGAVPSLCK